MELRKLILLIIIISFASCNQITNDDIKGNWLLEPSGYGYPDFWEIEFKENSVELIGENLFKEFGKYQIKNGHLEIELKRDDLKFETQIQILEDDTLVIFDSLKYHRKTESSWSTFEQYELIGIPTNKYLSKEGRYFGCIHFYKSKENKKIVRVGDHIVMLEQFPRFLNQIQSIHKPLILIGQGITLKDLKILFYCLVSNGPPKVILGTKRYGLSDTHIFKDEIEIWWDDLESQLATSRIPQPPPPPPPIEFTSKKEFLKNGGKEIIIDDKKAIRKLENLKTKKRYVISIDSNLTIEDYIQIKKKVNEMRKSNSKIITEIK